MSVGRVFSIADPAAVAEGAGVLAAFGTSVVIVTRSSLGRIGPKGREGTPMRKMIPTTTYGARGFCLPCKFQEVQLYISFPPIKGMVGGCFPTKVYIVGEPCKSRELTVGRADDLLVSKHLDSPVGEGSQKDCTKNSKGRKPPID